MKCRTDQSRKGDLCVPLSNCLLDGRVRESGDAQHDARDRQEQKQEEPRAGHSTLRAPGILGDQAPHNKGRREGLTEEKRKEQRHDTREGPVARDFEVSLPHFMNQGLEAAVLHQQDGGRGTEAANQDEELQDIRQDDRPQSAHC